MTVDLGRIDWIALGAIATFLLALGTVWLGWQTRTSVGELREARVAESLPVLHWQSPGDGYVSSAAGVEINLRLLLTNVGSGRPLAVFRRDDDERRAFQRWGFGNPSTLPARERIELHLSWMRPIGAYPGARETVITVRYRDLAGLRTYETRPRVTAHWLADNSGINAFDADERSPEERRLARRGFEQRPRARFLGLGGLPQHPVLQDKAD